MLTKDDVAFTGNYFIVFSTTDKQTGISHYEIMEEPAEEFKHFSWGGVDAPWVTANSPYVLQDQSLNSIIRVKAIDKAGNEYVATLIPDETMQSISRNQILIYVFIGIGATVLLILAMGLWFFIRRRKSNNDDVVEIETE